MKQTLRQHMLKKRNEVPKLDIQKKSDQIKQRFFSLRWYKDAENILFYVSYDNEVNTHDMIKESLQDGKTVIVPVTDTRMKSLQLSKLVNWDDLCPGAYSILEPRKGCVQMVAESCVDLIIVPGIVFDLHGNRIGHGMGYYDRLLKKCVSSHSIGLAFEFQLIDLIPAEEHDKKIQMIITEKRSIHCH